MKTGVARLAVIFSFFVVTSNICLGDDGIELCIEAKCFGKTPVFLGMVKPVAKELREFCETVHGDLNKSGQLDVTVKKCKEPDRAKSMSSLAADGVFLAIFVSRDKDDRSFVWRLYDTSSETMISGKKVSFDGGGAVSDLAHKVAEDLFKELTGFEGCFTSKLAYCREVAPGRKKKRCVDTNICVSDHDGKNEQVVVASNTSKLAPRWGTNPVKPMIFYSEHAPKNVRLMAVNLRTGRGGAVSNFDGLNMLPAFSCDGEDVVFCLSKDGSSQLYRYSFDSDRKKGLYKRITSNNGNNISPVLLDNGDIIFCSDFETQLPQIYRRYASDGRLERLTSGGYCVAPGYSKKRNEIAYSRSVRGVLQLFVYNPATDQHRQITFDVGSKDECSWSPCGNYLAFSVDNGNSGRIEIFNFFTNERQIISPRSKICRYPSWSPKGLIL